MTLNKVITIVTLLVTLLISTKLPTKPSTPLSLRDKYLGPQLWIPVVEVQGLYLDFEGSCASLLKQFTAEL